MSEFDDNMFYDEDGIDDSYDSDDDNTFVGEKDEFLDDSIIPQKKYFAILSDKEVLDGLKGNISEVSLILSVPNEVASLLLLHFKWDVNEVNEAWFANEGSVRKAIGLMDDDDDQVIEVTSANEVKCGICFDDYGFHMVKWLSCCHPFCVTCWKGYISSSINDGPGCLFLKCPMPKCAAAVGEGFITEFASDAEKHKYQLYMIRSYVEMKKLIKWCPFPDCGNAVEYFDESGSYDVTCSCSHSFCWNCIQELHRPVDCGTVEKWNLKNSNESENTTWILAYTKNCPKCKRAIEKNQGCNHMTCGMPCGHQFCWLCLRDWNNHHGNCNRYKEGTPPEGADEVIRQRAKKMLERYMHYYERWASNHKSREKAHADLEKMQSGLIKVISETNCQEEHKLSFIIDAWQQIIECRRVLKWTYAYGYYLPEEEYTKKQFFEYLQGEAEAGLERLHRCAETELEDYYIEGRSPSLDFLLFRTKLMGLTKVTATYFENLLTALENGLEDVNSHVASGTHEVSENSKRQKRELQEPSEYRERLKRGLHGVFSDE
ncbi:ubiquitin-protein ligase [Lithospermum erythrorhizon]|uniref:RBR-type E3 ubiquitin transferase n=1 Tax=Lithospermum erythrorhizon TaxID=34254 RepID=A0AAV3PS25_LITER